LRDCGCVKGFWTVHTDYDQLFDVGGAAWSCNQGDAMSREALWPDRYDYFGERRQNPIGGDYNEVSRWQDSK
jgi:hypothetical protein